MVLPRRRRKNVCSIQKKQLEDEKPIFAKLDSCVLRLRVHRTTKKTTAISICVIIGSEVFYGIGTKRQIAARLQAWLISQQDKHSEYLQHNAVHDAFGTKTIIENIERLQTLDLEKRLKG